MASAYHIDTFQIYLPERIEHHANYCDHRQNQQSTAGYPILRLSLQDYLLYITYQILYDHIN